MKNLKKLSRTDLKNTFGGGPEKPSFGFEDAEPCKQCVSCSNRQGSQSCYTDPSGDCSKAASMAGALC